MPMDGIMLDAICNELNSEITGGKIDKIQQPENDTVIIGIRSESKNKKLLLTLGSQPRIHLTNESYQNPQLAPSFCMLLRKHLVGGRIQGISRPGNERIVFVDILSANELGDITNKRIIIEIMGKYSNIILVNSEGIIIDAIKRVSSDISRVRQVMPHDVYTLPPNGDKYDLSVENMDKYLLDTPSPTAENICANFIGVSKLSAQEMLTNGSDSIRKFMHKFKAKAYSPCVVVNDGQLVDFLPFNYSIISAEQRDYPSFSQMLDDFCSQKDRLSRTRARSKELRDMISNNISRAQKKHGIYMQKQKECEKMEQFRIYGELITANIYRIARGSKSITANNYYSPDNDEITIPLDCTVSPQANAQKYFKHYGKLKTALRMLDEQIATNNTELQYFESLMVHLENCTDLLQLEEIKQELILQGYIKKTKKNIKLPPSRPMLFISPDGTEIYVGRNNIQNDELTLRIASKDDIWLHIKDAAGSHVIIRHTQPSDETIEIAACLAAFYSKAKQSSKVAVDSTKVRFVKKPRGAKPGMVTYDNYTTYYVTPSEAIAKKYAKT